MVVDLVHIQSVTEAESEQLAAQFQATPDHQCLAAARITPQLAATFGWTTWPKVSIPGEQFLLSIAARPAVLLRFEPDEFNSAYTGIVQERLHWLLNPNIPWTVDHTAKLAQRMRAALKNSTSQLIALRLLGHPSVASQIFQMAGFRLILGNAWFYREPDLLAPSYMLPPGVEFEFRNLRKHPLQDKEYAQAIAMAGESNFPDRFSMDIHIDAQLARRRFLAITENALSGRIADYAVLSWVESRLQGLVFFGIGKQHAADRYPVAGKWITTLGSPSEYRRGVSFGLVAEAIRKLPEGKAHWTAACALDHILSVRVAQKLGFRMGTVAYDLHCWRDE
jgi:hypothetical protein